MLTLDVVACLQGQRILVVEDDFFQAQDADELLKAAGATVLGPVPGLKDAAFLVAIAGRLDGAVLDINLGGQMVYPLADQLMMQGVPIVFATGYGRHDIPARFKAVPHCGKPVEMSSVASALSAAISAPQEQSGIQEVHPPNLRAARDGLVSWAAFAAYMDRAVQR